MEFAMVAAARRRTENREQPAAAAAYVFPTDLGWLAIAYSGSRLQRISFGHPSSASAAAALPHHASYVSDERDLPESIRRTVQRLQRFAAGEADDFGDVELDLSHLTDFQLRVVKACRRIKAGKSRSYGELAALAGSPRAARAVGNVMRGNRFPLIVPCHRVIGSNGKLCGFTCPDGLAMKEKLLQREGTFLKQSRKAR
jgi:methylated-DNA-[protein]-cysteine S-methyltransferase